MEKLTQLVSLSIHHSPKFNFLTLIASQLESLEIVSNEDLFISAHLVSLQILTARGNFKNINIPDTLSSLQNLHITDNASITELSIPSLPKLTMLDLCECENLNELTCLTETLPHLQTIQLTGCSENFISSLKDRLSDGWEWQGSEQQLVNANWIDTKESLESSNPQSLPTLHEGSSRKSNTPKPQVEPVSAVSRVTTLTLDTTQKAANFLAQQDSPITVENLRIETEITHEELSKLFNKVHLPSIKQLTIHSQQLIELNLPDLPNLTKLYVIRCQQLTKLSLPNQMNSLIELQLTRCPNLRELTLPKEMKQLTTCWLTGLQLTELEFPSEIKWINKLILKDCTHLTSLSIPELKHLKEH